MKNRIQTMILSALVAGLAVCEVSARPEPRPPLSCGATLTSDTTLQNDLDCSGPGAALVIGADNITVNLNGHALRSLDGLGVGVAIAGHNGVTLKNGVIDGFQEAVLAQESSDLTLQGLTIPSLSGRGGIPGHVDLVAAIRIEGGARIQIQDTSIAAGPPVICAPSESCPDGVFGPDAILLESVSAVSIKSVHIDGGFSGVYFGSCADEAWCPNLAEQAPSTGELKNCTIANNYIGVQLFNAAHVTVTDNVISGASGQGIRIGVLAPLPPSQVTIAGNELFGNEVGILSWLLPYGDQSGNAMSGILIKGNKLHDNVFGIQILDMTQSLISDNTSSDNVRAGINLAAGCVNNVISGNRLAKNGRRGLVFTGGANDNWVVNNTALKNGVDGISLFLGQNIGNRITDNVALGNGVWDLFHNDESTPNVWDDNKYNTKSGADIP